MAERIFGLETEYAFAALGPRGERIPSEPVLNRFMELAKELPHLGGKDSGGIFLENGSRFYIDTGYHPELATAEVANPWDACRYVLAGSGSWPVWPSGWSPGKLTCGRSISVVATFLTPGARRPGPATSPTATRPTCTRCRCS